MNFSDLVFKGRELPIGTKRKHGGVMKVKTPKGWVPVKEGKESKGNFFEKLFKRIKNAANSVFTGEDRSFISKMTDVGQLKAMKAALEKQIGPIEKKEKKEPAAKKKTEAKEAKEKKEPKPKKGISPRQMLAAINRRLDRIDPNPGEAKLVEKMSDLKGLKGPFKVTRVGSENLNFTDGSGQEYRLKDSMAGEGVLEAAGKLVGMEKVKGEWKKIEGKKGGPMAGKFGLPEDSLQLRGKPERRLSHLDSLQYLGKLEAEYGRGEKYFLAVKEALDQGFIRGSALVGKGYKNPTKAASRWLDEKLKGKKDAPKAEKKEAPKGSDKDNLADQIRDAKNDTKESMDKKNNSLFFDISDGLGRKFPLSLSDISYFFQAKDRFNAALKKLGDSPAVRASLMVAAEEFVKFRRGKITDGGSLKSFEAKELLEDAPKAEKKETPEKSFDPKNESSFVETFDGLKTGQIIKVRFDAVMGGSTTGEFKVGRRTKSKKYSSSEAITLIPMKDGKPVKTSAISRFRITKNRSFADGNTFVGGTIGDMAVDIKELGRPKDFAQAEPSKEAKGKMTSAERKRLDVLQDKEDKQELSGADQKTYTALVEKYRETAEYKAAQKKDAPKDSPLDARVPQKDLKVGKKYKLVEETRPGKFKESVVSLLSGSHKGRLLIEHSGVERTILTSAETMALVPLAEGKKDAPKADKNPDPFFKPDEKGPISMFDDSAAGKLKQKIERAKRDQERMKVQNKVVRNKKMTDEEKVKALGKLGVKESSARALLEPDFAGRKGYPAYRLSNNKANIYRMENRVKEIEREGAINEIAPADFKADVGGTLIDNEEENRIQLKFAGKPSSEMRTKLKQHGFRWSPSRGVWQAYRNANTRRKIKDVIGIDPFSTKKGFSSEPFSSIVKSFTDIIESTKTKVNIKKPFTSIIKAKALPIGTKRKHGKVLKVKTAEGWVPVKEEKTAAPEEEVPTKEAPKKEEPKKESALDKQRSQIESQANTLALGMTSSDMLDEKALEEKFKAARAETLKIDAELNKQEGKEEGKRRWQEHANGPPPLPEFTMEAIKNPDGTIKEDRRKAHDAIVAKYVDRVEPTPKDKKPVAIMMMGGPGSGKSSLLKDIDFTKFVHCDSDQMKKHIPEYHAAVASGARKAAYMVHFESALIGDRIRDTTIEQGKNIILDGTGRWFNHYKEIAEKLKEKGYHVQIIMPHITYDQAKPRVESRAEVTGRFVPDKILTQAYEAIPRNFEALAAIVDEAVMFDNGGPLGTPPKKVVSYEGGNRTDHEAEFMTSFRKEYGDSEPLETKRPGRK